MTRFVTALLVAADGTVKAAVDPRTRGAGGPGALRSAALLARAHREGRAQRLADDALMAEVAVAMREVPGEGKARDAGAEAWRIRKQQRGGAQ